MRSDQNLTPDELKALWVTDPNRCLLEWTYRMQEIPTLMDDPQPFVEYLCDEYTRIARKKPLLSWKATNLTNATHAFTHGHTTLSQWIDYARYCAGVDIPGKRILPKRDDEMRYAYVNVLNNLMKK